VRLTIAHSVATAQYFQVPPGVTSATFDLYGAQGSSATGGRIVDHPAGQSHHGVGQPVGPPRSATGSAYSGCLLTSWATHGHALVPALPVGVSGTPGFP